MSLARDHLEQKWREAARAPPGGREWRAVALPVAATVTMLAGVREPDGRFALLVEAPLALTASAVFRLQAEGVSVADQRRPDEGLRRLAVTLERDELHGVFAALVLDVVEIAAAAQTPAEACRAVVRRLAAWQSCLRSRRTRLSEEQQIGLMGELEILRLAAPLIGAGLAVEAWHGPVDGLHDFSGAGTAIEVKSVLGPGHLLRIPVLAQLDVSGLSGLVISRPRFREDPAGMRLADLVERTRSEVGKEAPAVLRDLDEKLLRAGVVAADADQGPRVVLDELYGYSVGDGFPRIRPSAVPAAISEVTYAIDERALGEFRLGRESLGEEMKRLGGGGA